MVHTMGNSFVRRRFGLPAAAWCLVVAGVASGCGDDDPKRAPAPEALTDALTALKEANTGTWSANIDFEPAPSSFAGSYRLQPAAQQFTREQSLASGESYEIDAIFINNDVFVRLPVNSGPPSQCWLGGDEKAIARITGSADTIKTGGFPGPIKVLATARGESYSPTGEIRGTVALSNVVNLIAGTVAEELDLKDGATVPTTFTLDDGTLTGFRINADDLSEAVDEAARGKKSLPDDTQIEATFGDAGGTTRIAPPETEQIIDLSGDPKKAQAKLDAC